MRAVACALALLAALMALAGWALVSMTQPDPGYVREAEEKATVSDRLDGGGRMIVDESTGESWIERADGSREYLTYGGE